MQTDSKHRQHQQYRRGEGLPVHGEHNRIRRHVVTALRGESYLAEHTAAAEEQVDCEQSQLD